MPNTWTSEQISLDAGMAIQVHASEQGVSVAKQVDGVFASDTLYTPEQAEQLAAALTEGAARSRAMREGE